MNVSRIRTTSGSRIEPAFEEGWDELTKLTWKAAVVTHDIGIHVEVCRSRYTVEGAEVSGSYDVRIGSSIAGPHTFTSAWDYLSGVATGAQQARRQPPAA